MNKDETYAYFTIDGSGSSSVITDILGIKPTREFSEGDPRKRVGTYKFMKWMLYSRLEYQGSLHDSLEQHVEDVLIQIEAFKRELFLLSDEYNKYIQCVAYYYGSNLGCGLPSHLLKRIAALDLGVEFDLYSLSDEERST